jgi:hypothetical protein
MYRPMAGQEQFVWRGSYVTYNAIYEVTTRANTSVTMNLTC